MADDDDYSGGILQLWNSIGEEVEEEVARTRELEIRYPRDATPPQRLRERRVPREFAGGQAIVLLSSSANSRVTLQT